MSRSRFNLAAAGVAIAAGAGLFVGEGLTLDESATLLVLAAVAALAFLTFARAPWIVTAAVSVSFLAVDTLPVVAKFGGGVIRMQDLVLGGALAAALLRGRKLPRSEIRTTALLLVGFGVARTGIKFSAATISYLRVLEPLVLLWIVPRLAPANYPLWRIVRAVAIVIVVEGLITSSGRITSWAGGPNETGLVAVALVLLTFAVGGRGVVKLAMLALGGLAIIQSRSVSTALALAVGFVALAAQRRHLPRMLFFRRAVPASLALLIVPFAILIPVATRPDLALTLSIHSSQAASAGSVIGQVNPVIGNGWKASAGLAVEASRLGFASFHNVYIDWFVNLGLIGIVLLLAFLYRISRVGGIATAVLAATVVWFNTVGAFPDAAWALVAVCAADGLAAPLWAANTLTMARAPTIVPNTKRRIT